MAYKSTAWFECKFKGGSFMTIRMVLMGCALSFATLASGTAAFAGDPYGGFGPGPSDPGGQETVTDPSPDPAIGVPTLDQTLPWLQPQSQNQPESNGGTWDRGPVSGEYDMDDEGGH
jgi:hypothetical protein